MPQPAGQGGPLRLALGEQRARRHQRRTVRTYYGDVAPALQPTPAASQGRFLALENGIPSHDTFSRLFAKLDPAGLQKALLRLAQDWADRLGDVVAVDGKALRRSFEDASERSPTHLLLTVRGGVEADAGAYWKWTVGRSAGPGDDPGAAGAAGTGGREGAHGDGRRVYAQRGTAAAIVAKGGDYALALKGNRGTLYADAAEYLDNPRSRRTPVASTG